MTGLDGSPLRLSPRQTEWLLHDLCVKLGYCLTPPDQETVKADPPTSPEAFAALVMKLEGVDPDDPDKFFPVIGLVLKAFEAAARARSPRSDSAD